MMAQTNSNSRSSHRRIITAFPNFGPATNPRVPHISLVFREMWDTTALDPRILEPSQHHRESTGAPRSPQRTWDENDGRSPTTAFPASTDKFISIGSVAVAFVAVAAAEPE